MHSLCYWDHQLFCLKQLRFVRTKPVCISGSSLNQREHTDLGMNTRARHSQTSPSLNFRSAWINRSPPHSCGLSSTAGSDTVSCATFLAATYPRQRAYSSYTCTQDAVNLDWCTWRIWTWTLEGGEGLLVWLHLPNCVLWSWFYWCTKLDRKRVCIVWSLRRDALPSPWYLPLSNLHCSVKAVSLHPDAVEISDS